MSKRISKFSWYKSMLMLFALMLLGITNANAEKYELTLGQNNTPAANDYYLFTPSESGYLLISFDQAIDMTGNEGVFFTYVGGWEDTVQDAAVCNGTPTGKTGSVVYCGGTYTEYTGVTKVAYKVNSGTSYCIWGGTVSIQLAPFTATFSTTVPDFGGGGDSGSEPEGTDMGTFPAGIDSTVKVEPASDGYVLITFDSTTDMTGQYGVFYTWHPSWGADVTMTAIESNGTDAGQGNVPAYGAYQQYTGVSKVLYEVKGGNVYCVWNAPVAGTITFYTEKPSLGSGGGSDTPTPSKKVIYICDNTQYKDPSEPLVVELGDDGNYTFTLDMTSGIRMSTTKSTTTSWNGFEVGEFNMYAGEAADRQVAENMLGKPIRLWKGAEEYGPAGWLYLPWIGEYTGVIPADLATITLTTTTEKPAINYPLTDPAEGELEAGFGGVILMWADNDVVTADQNLIYITNPDPNGENLTVEGGDLEITFTKLEGGGGYNTYAEGDPVPGNVIAIDINPESKYYDEATSALINPYPYPVEISVVLPANSITVNDIPNDEQIVRNFIIPAGDANPELTPVGRIIVPVPGAETVPGFQWVYSTYAEDGTWLTDYLPLEFNENYVNPNGKSYPEATVSVPGSTSTFQFRILISDNDVMEEPGYNGPGKDDEGKKNPNYKQVDNTALLKNFYYNELGIINTWQKEGDYKVTVPSGVFYITLRNEDGSLSDTRILNAETTLVYHCIGQHDIASYAQLKAPTYTKSITEIGENTDFGTVELDNEVIVSWATYTKNDVPTPLTLSEGKAVTVSLNGANAVEVPVTLLDHWADNVVNGTNYNDPGLKIDLSQFNNAAGTYVITLPQGIVYSEETDFQNNLYNMKQVITFDVAATTSKTTVNFQFELPEELELSMSDKPFLIYQGINDGLMENMVVPSASPFAYEIEGELPQNVYVAFRSGENKVTGYTVKITNNEGVAAGNYEYTVADGDFAGNSTVEADINFKGDIAGKTFVVSVIEIPAEPEVPAVLYVGNIKSNGARMDTDVNTDVQLTLNSETGNYEGVISNWPVKASGLNYNAKGFYSIENGEYTYYGGAGTSDALRGLRFDQNPVQEFGVDANANSQYIHGWYLNNTTQVNPPYDVKVVVNLETMQATFTWINAPAPKELPLETLYFFPQANEKYTFEATEEGTLKLEFNEGVTLAGDVFFTSGGAPVSIKSTDGTEGMFPGWISGVTYVEYSLVPGSYYFQWNKNDGSDDYSVYATFSTGGAEPALNALVFDDFDMTFTKGSEDAVTVTLPVSLDVDDPFDYKGFQFDITLPLNLKATAVALNSELELGQYGTATVVPYSDTKVPANTYRVLANFNKGTDLTEEIVTLTISGVYNDQMVNEKEYDVTIQNTVIFSSTGGSDITDVNGYTGTLTVYIEIPAEEITFEKVELAAPSFTDEEGNVTEVTQGESVDMTIVVEPADTTDELEVSADNGATVTQNEDGTWNVDTSGVEVAEGEEVTVTVTAKAGDVEETYELTVKGVLLGDSNANGKVTVADVITTANYIAEKEIDNFCFPNANVILTPNEEGQQVINAQDLTATINIILKIWDGIRTPQNIRRYANRSFTNDRLVASDFHAGNSVISVDMDNTGNYAAIEATVEIPAGMKIQNVTVGPRAAAHELVYNVKGDELHVVLFSYENASFRGGEGSLFNIAVVADENCGDLQMKNILASDAASNGYELSFEGGLYGEATGIEGIDADAEGVRYFTVDGIEVFNTEAGQILIRIANGSAEKVIIK